MNRSGCLLGSTHAADALMCILGRVSVAWMATVKPHGWVYASLERVRMSTSFPKWRELDNQTNHFFKFRNKIPLSFRVSGFCQIFEVE